MKAASLPLWPNPASIPAWGWSGSPPSFRVRRAIMIPTYSHRLSGLWKKSSGKTYGQNADNDISIRVIADHSRAVTFLIGDGITPSNEGRGYVLRRILRRAARHGKMLGINKPFLNECAQVVIDMMKGVYPDLVEKASFITKMILNEEQRFMETLDAGLRILQEETAALKKDGKSVLPGALVFKLYDTFGFPTDLTADIVKRDGFTLDNEGFESEMEQQRERARGAWKGSGEEAVAECYLKASSSGIITEFCGYEGAIKAQSKVAAIFIDGQSVQSADEGQDAEIVLDGYAVLWRIRRTGRRYGLSGRNRF